MFYLDKKAELVLMEQLMLAKKIQLEAETFSLAQLVLEGISILDTCLIFASKFRARHL